MPVSVLLPHVYREKKDPLDVLAQGLNIASSIYGLKVDMEKMDDYRSNRDLLKGVREGDEKAIEQVRRESQMKNLVTDEQLTHIFKDSKVLTQKPTDDDDYLEIGTTAGQRYVKPPRQGKDGWTGKDFANVMEKGFGVSESQSANSLRVKGMNGTDYFITPPPPKAKEEKGRPQSYEDSSGSARIGNWDGKTVIKDEANDAFAVTKKGPARKEGEGGGYTTDDVKFRDKKVTEFVQDGGIKKELELYNSAKHIRDLLKLKDPAADSTIATEYNKLGRDSTAPTEGQMKNMGGSDLLNWVNRSWGKYISPDSASFSEKDRKNMDRVAEISMNQSADNIRLVAKQRAKAHSTVSNGISEQDWYKQLNPDGLLNPSVSIKDEQKAWGNRESQPKTQDQYFSPNGRKFQLQEKLKKGFDIKAYKELHGIK